MKTKLFTLFSASLILAVLALSMVSALTVSLSSLNFNADATTSNSQTITITGSNNSNIDFPSEVSVDEANFTITGNKSLDTNNQTILTIKPKENLNTDAFDFDTLYSGSFVVSMEGNSIDNKTVTVTVTNNEFCEKTSK